MDIENVDWLSGQNTWSCIDGRYTFPKQQSFPSITTFSRFNISRQQKSRIRFDAALKCLLSVGATRFELAASSSQSWHSTGLSYTPNLSGKMFKVNIFVMTRLQIYDIYAEIASFPFAFVWALAFALGFTPSRLKKSLTFCAA